MVALFDVEGTNAISLQIGDDADNGDGDDRDDGRVAMLERNDKNDDDIGNYRKSVCCRGYLWTPHHSPLKVSHDTELDSSLARCCCNSFRRG